MSFLFRARFFFRTSSTSNLSHPTPCRKFHISSNLLHKRRPPVAPDTNSISSNSTPRSPYEIFRPYSEKEKAALAKKYTPEQLQAIEEGEAAIDPEDILKQGNFRTDPYKLPYVDDLSIIRPVIDKKPREAGTIPDNARSMTEDEAADDVSRWLVEEFYESREAQARGTASSSTDTPIKPSRLDFRKYLEESTSMTGGGKRGSSVIAPALPKDPELKAQYQMSKNIDSRDPDGKWVRLQKQTGLTLDEILDYKIKVLVSHRVVNQTRLGKIQSMYVLAVAGDGHGRLGIGEGKATEIEEATDKARQAAVRNMRPIPRYEERTIFGEVEGKVAACEVQLMARPPGFGLRCQHNIFEMARCTGIQDLAARVPRSRNKMNTIKAAYQALLNQRLPDEIARGRGKKLVDVRKVYYGGNQSLIEQPRSDITIITDS